MRDCPQYGGHQGSVDSVSTVIIEGPDGAGKSTLLRRLLEKHPEYQQAPRACSSLGGPLCGTDLAMYLTQYGCMGSAIYDRHPSISGAVYEAVFHRPLDPTMGRRLREAFYWITENARVIYCRPPAGVIAREVATSSQMPGVTKNISRIIATYDSIMYHLVPHEVYDWTTDALPSL